MANSTLQYFLLITSLVVLYISVPAKSDSFATPTEFIKASCDATTYPELCIQSLSTYAKTIQKSPRQLCQTALSVCLSKVQFAHKFVSSLRKFKGLTKKEYKAIDVCFDQIDDTADRLTKSVSELRNMATYKKGGDDFIWHMSNIQTWVSAALTDETTCLDGFSDLNGKIKNSIRARFVHVAQVTSNALALINKFAEA